MSRLDSEVIQKPLSWFERNLIGFPINQLPDLHINVINSFNNRIFLRNELPIPIRSNIIHPLYPRMSRKEKTEWQVLLTIT